MDNYILKDWIPYRLDFRDPAIVRCEWRFISDKRFIEPFYQNSTSKCTIYAENRQIFVPTTHLESVLDFAEKVPSIEPKAFIFHVSRCGSTLLSQLLSLDNQNIVISEAPILDEVLREISFSKSEVSEEEINNSVKAIIKLLGKKRTEDEKQLFIKLDSWHIFYYDKLRKLYPDTTFIFLFRRPDEVIRSQLINPGMHAARGVIQPTLFGYELNEVLFLDPEVYISKVLEKYFESFLKIIEIDKNTLFVDYAEGILPIFNKIIDFLNLEIDENTKRKMIERTRFHSKSPNTVFEEKLQQNETPVHQKKAFEFYQKLRTFTF